MFHSDSVSPASQNAFVALLGVEDLLDWGLCQAFPVHLANLGVPGLSDVFSHHLIQLATRC